MKPELCAGTKYLELIFMKPTYSYIISQMVSSFLTMYLNACYVADDYQLRNPRDTLPVLNHLPERSCKHFKYQSGCKICKFYIRACDYNIVSARWRDADISPSFTGLLTSMDVVMVMKLLVLKEVRGDGMAAMKGSMCCAKQTKCYKSNTYEHNI